MTEYTYDRLFSAWVDGAHYTGAWHAIGYHAPDMSCCNSMLFASDHTRQRFSRAVNLNERINISLMLTAWYEAFCIANGQNAVIEKGVTVH